jgi:hypothetical protein
VQPTSEEVPETADIEAMVSQTLSTTRDMEPFAIHHIGARSGKTYKFEVHPDDPIGKLKAMIFMELHGLECESSEKVFTETHHLMLVPSNRILINESHSFHDYGIHKASPPFEVTFCIGLVGGAGGRRKLDLESADMTPKATDHEEVKTMLTLFTNPWSQETWEEMLTHETVTIQVLGLMKDVVKGRSGTMDDKALRVLSFIPRYVSMKDTILKRQHHTHTLLNWAPPPIELGTSPY